ncbi:MAG: hypothetical protein ACR2RF_28555 [Geminicoccaceae bacterium]
MHDQNADCSTMGPLENARGGPAAHHPTLSLIVSPSEGNAGRRYGDRFDARLDGDLVVASSQPMYDGARALMNRGFPAETLLTMRHHNRDYDSFKPMTIGWLAQWTLSDSPKTGLSRRKWQPMPDHLKGKREKEPA